MAKYTHNLFIKNYMNDFIRKCIRTKQKIGIQTQEEKEVYKVLDVAKRKPPKKKHKTSNDHSIHINNNNNNITHSHNTVVTAPTTTSNSNNIGVSLPVTTSNHGNVISNGPAIKIEAEQNNINTQINGSLNNSVGQINVIANSTNSITNNNNNNNVTNTLTTMTTITETVQQQIKELAETDSDSENEMELMNQLVNQLTQEQLLENKMNGFIGNNNNHMNNNNNNNSNGGINTKKKSSYKPRGTRQIDPNIPNIPTFFVFMTLRDLFTSTNQNKLYNFNSLLHTIERDYPQIVEQVPINYNINNFLELAIKFLRSPPANSPSTQTVQHGDSLILITEHSQYKWIANNIRSSDEYLQSMEQLFFFALSRSTTDDFTPIKSNLSRAQKCIITIQPTPTDIVDQFRMQETDRFKNAEKPFVYNLAGNKSIVAPMKRAASTSNRAREHYLLKQDRPSHVTLLCLVRDSAARLPGGVGTRADVALLLRDSQYIVHDVTEQKINTVVSGALDRLHSEEDPCVKYDNEQKLWIYLHRNRKPEDFGKY